MASTPKDSGMCTAELLKETYVDLTNKIPVPKVLQEWAGYTE